jgi:putative cell wall-binding protein
MMSQCEGVTLKRFIFTIFILLMIFFQGEYVLAEEGVYRFSGKNRFEVAVNISKRGWPNSSQTVVIANYLAYADALAATPLAYQKNAPILLSHPNKLTLATKKEIERLQPTEVILVGGTGSLQDQIIQELNRLGIKNARRIDGKDRFEVAQRIADELGTSNTAVIANGLNFPDALAIAPYAARNGYPILLTKKSVIPENTKEVLQKKGITNTIVVGGEGSVGKAVFDNLPNPRRIGGKDRFEVARNIDVQLNSKSGNVFITTGFFFADALTGSVLAAKENASIFLTYPDRLAMATEARLLEKGSLNITILGGTGSVQQNIYIPGVWKIKKPGNRNLEGYASHTSVKNGEQITFYINSSSPYHLEFFRMGYYEGKGAEHVKTLTGMKAQIQKATPNPSTMDANWQPSVRFVIPNDWKTGFYLVKIVNKQREESYIPFVVREQQPNADFAVLIATNTYQAYNNWGGKSLYGYNSTNREPAVQVSFNRPYNERYGAGQFFNYEYNLIRWLEKKGYNLTYLTDTDVHENILSNSNIKALIIAGHDEYWTKEMRDYIEQKHNTGNMDIAVLSANVGYWQSRLEQNNRLLVCYKHRAGEDPYNEIDPSYVTTLFRSPPVNRPEEGLFGMMYRGIPDKTMPLVVTNTDHWIYEGTTLKNGDQIEGVVGGEIDRYDKLNPNVELIARSPVKLYGHDSYSDVIWFNKPSGSKVFAVGTFYWNWFLDPYGHEGNASYNPNIERMTMNVLERMVR